MADYFSLPSKLGSLDDIHAEVLTLTISVFFITFREALETSIIVSVLLALIKRTLTPQDDPSLRQKLANQVCARLRD